MWEWGVKELTKNKSQEFWGSVLMVHYLGCGDYMQFWQCIPQQNTCLNTCCAENEMSFEYSNCAPQQPQANSVQ